jgi:arylsulfatase A-like enzyme
MCEWFDETVGDLVARVERLGMAQNTIFVYIADNGWIQQPNGNGYAPRSKQSPYEGGVRQPILFRWDKVIQPRSYDDLVSAVDIVPTLLSATGAKAPVDLPGVDLLGLIRDGQPLKREIVFGEGFSHDVLDMNDLEATLLYRWAIRGRWKLILTYDGEVGKRYASSHPRSERGPQLFDVEADPFENRNLAKQHPQLVAELAQKIAGWWPVSKRQCLTEP